MTSINPLRQKEKLVQNLAESANVSEDDARRAYEGQYLRLALGARVKTYLPVLAARRAREMLRQH